MRDHVIAASTATPATPHSITGVVPDDATVTLPRPLSAVLWTTAIAIAAGWLVLAAIHVDDEYRVTHTQGVWIATAEAARAGRFYPPLFDGTYYSGTRYMPVPILLNAAAAAVTGDPLAGGKLLAAALMGILLILVLMVLRQVSCPWPIAAALTAAIVATDAGLQAGTTIGGDVAPVVLQLGALALALRGRDERSIASAGILAGLAAASKLTGVWAAAAILTWLALHQQWRRAAIFTIACGVTAAVLLGAVQLITDGGLTEHLLAFSGAGIKGIESLLRAPNQLLYQLVGHASAALVLVPLAVVGALVSWSSRNPSLIHLAWSYALLLLLVVYADLGTGANQLLDIIVLTVLAVGVLAGRAAREEGHTARVILLTVAVGVIWGAGVDLIRTVGRDVRLSGGDGYSAESSTRASMASIVRPGERLLTDDPYVAVALGQRPLIMDPFMLTRLDRVHPEWVDPLIIAIEQRRFDVVVLVVRLENREVDFWWTDYHFGPRVARALRNSYRADGRARRYHIYRPAQ
jgi:hypothetical protein